MGNSTIYPTGGRLPAGKLFKIAKTGLRQRTDRFSDMVWGHQAQELPHSEQIPYLVFIILKPYKIFNELFLAE